VGQHKHNPMAIAASAGKLNGEPRVSRTKPAAGGPGQGGSPLPPGMTPGAWAMQLNRQAWYDLVCRDSRDMVCPNCGFGFLLPVYAMKMVPAMLHPAELPAGTAEAPLPIQEYWACMKCFQAIRAEDFKVLPLRQRAPNPDGSEPDGPGSGEAPEASRAEGETCRVGEAERRPPSARAPREYLGTACPVCGIEQFRVGDRVTCAQGHDRTEDGGQMTEKGEDNG